MKFRLTDSKGRELLVFSIEADTSFTWSSSKPIQDVAGIEIESSNVAEKVVEKLDEIHGTLDNVASMLDTICERGK